MICHRLMKTMNLALNKFTVRIMRACPPFALVVVLALAGFGCGKSSQARTEGAKTPIPTSPVWADSDSDGIPDAAELRSSDDRDNFRRWFVHIAEMQFYKPSGAWNEDQRDCAGLVRFAWREALRSHDRAWFQMMGEGYEAVAPDVKAYDLKRGLLGEKLFRADFGSFQESDLANGKFSEFADARTLKNYNSDFISRDRHQAQRDGLLF